MRILLLTHAFNSLTQRCYVELAALGHQVSVEFDIHETVTLEAIEAFGPELIVAPFLKRILPESIYGRYTCLIIHPGIVGDRGPSALDWAISERRPRWGVTILRAEAEVDGGAIYASRQFPLRHATKSSIYRHEVTEAAVSALQQILAELAAGSLRPRPLASFPPGDCGSYHPLMTQNRRAIDWQHDDTEAILTKIYAADSSPGVRDQLCGVPVYLSGAHREERLSGPPHRVIAVRAGAVLVGTRDGAVWITHLKRRQRDHPQRPIKLPAAQVLGAALSPEVPEAAVGFAKITDHATWQDIYYEIADGIGYLHVDVPSGALSTELCRRLTLAYRELRDLAGARVIALMGGADFWLNGIDLNAIEAADSAADESWRNINALNDFVREVIQSTAVYTIAALRGNAAAGGVFAALACDWVVARQGIVLNPHYKNMGNLYGSEYFTYLLPKKVEDAACRQAIRALRLPIGVTEAMRLGLVDQALPADSQVFERRLKALAAGRAADQAGLDQLLRQKHRRRMSDEARKPLAAYRDEELAQMKLNFYGWDPSYHKARYNFVHKIPLSRTPRYLARHRQPVKEGAAEG